MTAVNGDLRRETAALAHVEAAKRLARAAVSVFSACELMGVPFTDAQKIAVLEAMLLEFDGFAARLRLLDGIGELLHELDHD